MISPLRALARRLDDLEWSVLATAMTGSASTTPWDGDRLRHERLRRLEAPERALVGLLCGGETVTLDDAQAGLGRGLVEALVTEGVLHEGQAGGVSLGGRTMLVHCGMYLLTDAWRPGDEAASTLVYVGDDSLWLAHALRAAPGDRALDIGCGCGIQSLCLAQRGARVVATDVNARATETTRLNARLNGFEDAIECVEGDLFEPVGHRTFDVICADPPFLPFIASGGDGAIFADGGPDGLALVRRILAGVPRHLTPAGRCLLFAGSFADNGEPCWGEELATWARQQRLSVTVTILSERRADAHLREMQAKYPSLAAGIARRLAAIDEPPRGYVTWFLSARRSEAGVLRIVRTQTSMAERLRAARRPVSAEARHDEAGALPGSGSRGTS